MSHRIAPALVCPPALAPGARVALVAPAGPLSGSDDVARAESTARRLGWEPVVGRHVLDGGGYFAATDADRLADLEAALADRTIDAVWCLRGGYGTMRLLPALDLSLRRARPRSLIGFSDITALHAAWQSAGFTSFHGPVARAELTAFSEDSLRRAVMQHADSAGHAPGAIPLRGGRAEGRLAGGNLALVAALAGTPWALSFRGAIAVFEDIGEATYRIDRLFMQLRLAGAFDGCEGLVFGDFTDCPDTSPDGTRSVQTIAQELADAIGVPALFGVPIGHIADQWTVPLGAMATLDADACALHVHFDPR
ncbi:MAG: LD-carboxypeptidase [Gemmatimonadaceae bacterium]|jgi:muramoyltetrapeptide carboxypeptidase|nr:LD-carboxypeptidase [Gemmatimonadaceae bacterium]